MRGIEEERATGPKETNVVKPLLCLTAAAILLFVTTAAFGQTLWTSAAYGMSVEDVLQKVPATERVATGGQLGNGAIELARIPNLEIFNNAFAVRFYFLDEKLTRVTLALDRQVPYATARVVFDSFLKQFRSQYGRERLEEKQAGPLASSSATWLSGETRINLSLLGLPNVPPLLNVNFQAASG
jgi:hypothetical protein